MNWLKENRELAIGICILLGVWYWLFFSRAGGEYLDVKMTTENSDFSFAVWTWETEGREWKKVLKIKYDNELIYEQDKESLQKLINDLDASHQVDLPIESKKQSRSKKSVNIIFDVTQSYREWVVNDADPKDRFKKSLSFLEKRSKQYLAKSVKVGFLWAKETEVGKRRIINKDIYTFNLKPYKQGMTLRIKSNPKSYIYKEKGKNLFHFEDIDIELIDNLVEGKAKCEKNADDEFSFDCEGWPQALFATLKDIWNYYLEWEFSRGTFLLNYLYSNDFDKESDFLIFSDGEFQLTDDVHKKDLKRLNYDYRISDKGYVYNSDNYTNDSWFSKYWENAIKYINYMTDFCEESQNTLTFVGLSQTDNPPFIEFSREYFPKLFDGCKVEIRQF